MRTMTDDPSLAYTPSRYYSSSNRNCPPVSCSIYIYIYIYRACRCFVPWGSIAFDERLTNETSVRDRITKRVLFITGRVEDDTRQGR